MLVVGGVQVPDPVHVPAVPMLERASAEQEAVVVQGSPAWVWQALPSVAHSALVPQVWSAQALAQQTLLVPLLMQEVAPLTQSLIAVHRPPSATGGLHWPPMHMKPVAHVAPALAAVQLVAHMAPEHT